MLGIFATLLAASISMASVPTAVADEGTGSILIGNISYLRRERLNSMSRIIMKTTTPWILLFA